MTMTNREESGNDETLANIAALSAISKTAILGGLDEYEKTYQRATAAGVGRHEAQVQALASMHEAQERLFLERAAQAAQSGNPRLANLLADSALQARTEAHLLSTSAENAKETLELYALTRHSEWSRLAGASDTLKFLRKYGGPMGDVADLSLALVNGSDGDVAKAVTGIVFGFTVSSLARAIVVAGVSATPVGAAALAITVIGTITMEFFVTSEEWGKLAEPFKDAIAGVRGSMSDIWQAFVRFASGAGEDISRLVNDKFLAALNLIRRIDPLVLDLDGDGIETLGADAGVLFDFDGDGVKTGTGWIKGDDGFLVLDRNGNGRIDSGAELFGVDTVKRDGKKARNGFDALADLDSNGDGVFDANDEMFSHVRVWQDLNKDGIAQANEMKSLSEHGIRAIVLKSREANEDSNGNLISATGTFIRDDGTEGEVNGNQSLAADVDLESNPFYSEHTDPIELDDGARQLPNLQGSGMVRELREAAMLSPELRSLLEAYAASESHREQRDLLDRLISTWAATGEGYRPFEQRIDGLDRDGVDFRFAFSWETSGKQPTEAQKLFRDRLARLNVLESFNGQPFLEFTIESMSATSARVKVRMGANTTTRTVAIKNGVVVLTESDLPISNDALSLLDASYRELLGSVQSGLLLQTRLKSYADVVDITLDGDVIAPDFERVFQRLTEVSASDPVRGILDGMDLLRSLKSFDTGKLASLIESWAGAISPDQRTRLDGELQGEGRVIFGTASSSSVNAGDGGDLVFGLGGNDKLYGQSGDDFLWGQDGNDSLYGGDGNDVLIGGSGDDRLEGGAGSDTYLFGRGDGWDTIYNSDRSANRWDVLQFLDGITPEDVYVRRGTYNDLLIYIRGTKEGVTISDYFYNEASRLDDIRFADGTSWSAEQIKAMVLASSDGNDTLRGYASDDEITGGLGNDTLHGNGGNDRLEGGDGDDKLYGDDGNDVLIGGSGNDSLRGGAGSDTYLFGRGDGWDTIYNSDGSVGRRDVLQFLEGITPEDVYVRRGTYNDLLIYIRDTKEGVTISDYFYNEASRLDDIRFADGTSWSAEQIKAMVLAPSDGNDTLRGYASDDEITGGLGNDTLHGNGGNDRLEGDEGNDKLYVGDGNDVPIGGTASLQAFKSPSAWSIEHDLNALISAMAGTGSPGDMAGAVVPPPQQTQPNWASMAV